MLDTSNLAPCSRCVNDLHITWVLSGFLKGAGGAQGSARVAVQGERPGSEQDSWRARLVSSLRPAARRALPRASVKLFALVQQPEATQLAVLDIGQCVTRVRLRVRLVWNPVIAARGDTSGMYLCPCEGIHGISE